MSTEKSYIYDIDLGMFFGGNDFVLIVTSTKTEYESAIGLLEDIPELDIVPDFKVNHTKYSIGLLSNYLTVVIKCGTPGSLASNGSIETVNGAVAEWNPKIVILVGICFGINDSKQAYEDICVSEKIINYELACVNESGNFEQKKIKASEPNMGLLDIFTRKASFENRKIHKTSFLSGEKHIYNSDFIAKLQNEFPSALCGEMEGNGVALICNALGKPWIAIKAISDFCSGKVDAERSKSAAKIAIEYCKDVMKSYQEDLSKIGLQHYKEREENDRAINILKTKFEDKCLEEIYANRTKRQFCEIYKVKDGAITNGALTRLFFIFLGSSIRISDTVKGIKKNVEQIIQEQQKIVVCSYLVNPKRLSNIEEAFLAEFKEYCTTHFYFQSVDEFVWHPETKEKTNNLSHFPEFFVEQHIVTNEQALVNGMDIVANDKKAIGSPINIIRAHGGAGKTTLVKQIASELNKQKNRCAIFFSSEDIADINRTSKIASIDDLFKHYFADIRDQNVYRSIGHNIACGNYVVIVDGIDEFVAILNDRFDKNAFIDSLLKLNSITGRAKVILTARENFIDPERLQEKDFTVYTLRGFDSNQVEQFFKKKFGLDKEKCTFATRLAKEYNILKEEFYPPFLLDIIHTIVSNNDTAELAIDTASYPMCNEAGDEFGLLKGGLTKELKFTDTVILLLLIRECKRQHFEQKVLLSYLDFLSQLSAEHNAKITHDDARELVKLCFGEQISKKTDNILSLPLLERKNEIYCFKYEFLKQYFNDVYIINAALRDKLFFKDTIIFLSKCNNTVNSLKKIGTRLSEFADINVVLGNISKCTERIISKNYSISDDESYIVLSNLTYLAVYLEAAVDSTEKITGIIKQIYGGKKRLNMLSIIGNFFPIDFSELTISNGYFNGYDALLRSKIPNDRIVFDNCVFENINTTNSKKNNLINKSSFAQCKMDDELDVFFSNREEISSANTRNIIKDIENAISLFHYRNNLKPITFDQFSYKPKSKYGYTEMQDRLCDEGIIEKSTKHRQLYVSESAKFDCIQFLNSGFQIGKIKSLIDKLIKD